LDKRTLTPLLSLPLPCTPKKTEYYPTRIRERKREYFWACRYMARSSTRMKWVSIFTLLTLSHTALATFAEDGNVPLLPPSRSLLLLLKVFLFFMS